MELHTKVLVTFVLVDSTMNSEDRFDHLDFYLWGSEWIVIL